MTTLRFRIHSPLVALQVVDGEAVMIHFETGCYYGANATGSEIVRLLETPITPAEIVSELTLAWDVPRDVLERAVGDFLGQLREEQLVVCEPSDVPERPADSRVAPATESRGCWSVPALEKYSDLQDLLMLDPIHDVDGTGWPVPRPEMEAAA